MEYEPNKKSLKKHQAPSWYHGAKFGIFIHWGLYSVPAFAPIKYGEITQTVGKRGFKFHFAHNPYAEWYQNSIRIFKDDYKEYHTDRYGASFKYEEFAPIFNDAIQKWDPEQWAKTFKKVGAKYIVLTTKHHDGFLLWPSKIENPKKQQYVASRNIVGELDHAVRKVGLKMGLYYSGALDWTFNSNPIKETTSMLANAPKTERYGRYVDKQFFELIERFVPDVLWNDIGYPPKGNPLQTVTHYFNSVKLGAINDRWSVIPQVANILSHTFLIKKMINYIGKKVVASQGFEGHRPKGFSDFSTPEYQPNIGLKDYKWESCRGIGHSFGYNRMETAEQYLSERELIHSFVDTISKNGNLLLNIGPTAAGKIPEIQLKRLLALGQFIRRNEEGIYDTNTWQRATGTTTNGLPVRFTQKKNTLFVFLLGNPQCSKITIKNVKIPSSSKISLMGTDESIGWEQFGVDLRLNLPHTFPEFLSMGFKVSLA